MDHLILESALTYLRSLALKDVILFDVFTTFMPCLGRSSTFWSHSPTWQEECSALGVDLREGVHLKMP